MTNGRQTQRRRSCNITNPPRTPILFLFLACNSIVVAGTPVQSEQHGLLQKRDANSNSSGVTPKIMVSIIIGVIVVLLFCAALVAWKKNNLRGPLRYFSFFGRASVGGPMGGATTAPRELTAEQLAGTINGDIQTGNGNAAPRTTRRARRPRRTPSQMSVTSLPAYNKEPGEEELVIFRGRDMEDATMPAAIAMTSLDEERDGSSFSHDNSQTSRYSPMPTSPNNMPLLQNDSAYGDLSLQSLPDILPYQDSPRRSFGAGSRSSHETSSLMRTNSNLPEDSPDPRGDAPAYYEVVDNNELQNNRGTSTVVRRQPSTAPSVSPPISNPNRRSGFRTLLNRMSMASAPQGHNRNESVNSTFSSNVTHALESSSGRVSNHRTTPSGSGSLLSVSMFRTLSRQKSNHTLNSNRLNSPSLISLNSISSPLTHTATRTEFTYPKSGPTAEQLKVISSRESFARFGVPYGADAIAYASSSRLDLLPPPDFDSTVEAQVPRLAGSAGPSRLRSTSNVQHLSETTPPTGDDSIIGSTSPGNSDSPAPSSSLPANTDVGIPSPTTVSAAATAEHAAPISTNHNSLSGAGLIVPGAGAKVVENGESLSHSRLSTIQPVSEFGRLAAPPPSSYNEHTVSSTRSESRASVFTFATAAESLSPSTGQGSATDDYFSDVGNSEFDSAPSTPRLGGQHELEPTDMTIVPDPKRTTITASPAATSTSAGQ